MMGRARSEAGPFRFLRLDLYILTEVLAPFVGGVLFFSFVILMFQMLRLAEFFIVHGISGDLLVRLTSLLMLSFMPMPLPIALLIAVLVAFGRLSADGELTAIRASGVSLLRLSFPVLGLAVVISAISFALAVEWVPWGDRQFKIILNKVGSTKVVKSIKEGTFTTGFFDLLIFAEKVDVKTNRLENVFIYDERDAKNPVTVVAKEGEILPVRTDQLLGVAAILKLNDGNVHRPEPATNAYHKIDFTEYRLYLKVNEADDATVLKPRMFSSTEILERMRGTAPKGMDGIELRLEYWRRYAMAISPFIFVFLGMGFGTVRSRSPRAGAALVALVVVTLYWSIQAWGTVLAQQGRIPPIAAMALSNTLSIVVAAWSFIKSSR